MRSRSEARTALPASTWSAAVPFGASRVNLLEQAPIVLSFDIMTSDQGAGDSGARSPWRLGISVWWAPLERGQRRRKSEIIVSI